MTQTGTDPRLRKLRKYESILMISGFGVIAFGMWSIIRTGLYYFFNPLDLTMLGISEEDLAELQAIGEQEGVGFITDHMGSIIAILSLAFLGIDLLLRVYVGMSARKDGRRNKKRGIYIFVAWVMAIALLTGICETIDDLVRSVIEVIRTGSEEALQQTASNGSQAGSISILIDFTSMLALFELAVSGMKVRSLRKQLGLAQPKEKSKKQKRELTELTEGIRSEISDELNIPMTAEERKVLGREVSEALSSMSNITGD